MDSTKKILPADENEFSVDVRILPDDLLEKYKNDPDFNYSNVPSETDDWITKIKNWINQQLSCTQFIKSIFYNLRLFVLRTNDSCFVTHN